MDNVTERDSPISRMNVGSGKTSIESNAATKSASPTSDPGENLLIDEPFEEKLNDFSIPSMAEEKLL